MSAVHTTQLRDEYVVQLDVPSVADEDVDVDVADNVVTLRLKLPDDVDSAQVSATYAHGVFEVHAPPKQHRFAVNADASGV